MYKLILIALTIFLPSCAALAPFPTVEPGNKAKTVVSKNFSKPDRIAVFPFHNSGSKGGVNHQAADLAALKLMELGFTVVERTQLEMVLGELKLNHTGALSSKQLKEVGHILSVDAIVFGTVNWEEVPGESFASAYNAFSRDGYNGIRSATVRFVDVESGEVMINSYCCQIKPVNGILEEMAASINTSLLLQWGK